MDIDDDTKITLDIKSNLFRDVSKLASNSTSSVKLPKTVRNQMLMEHVDIVQSASSYPHLTHKARYFRGGVEIIKDGSVSVLSVSEEAIEVTIVWGLWPKFAALVNADTTLNQLESDARILWTGDNEADTYADALTKDYFYADIDVWTATKVTEYWNYNSSNNSVNGATWGGNKNRQTSSYLHPSVKVSWVLELIKTQKGVDFQFKDDAKTLIDSLILPLTNKKATDITFDEGFAATLPAISGETLGQIKPTITQGSNIFKETSGTVSQLTVIADAKLYVSVEASATYNMSSWTKKGSKGWNYDGCFVLMLVTKKDASQEYYYIGDPVGSTSSLSGHRRQLFSDWPTNIITDDMKGYGVVELEQGDEVSFYSYYCKDSSFGSKIKGGQTTRTSTNPPTTFKGGKVTISATGSDDTVPKGGYFPIAYNLPEVKIVDFVKFLSVITGTFPLQMSPDGLVQFVPLATIWKNKANAKDWTRRVIATGNENKPKSIEFTLDSWAQHNYYKWKEDDNVSGGYDGEIQIADETLDTERTVTTFPFAACDGNSVPLYTAAEEAGDDPDYSKCNDRILTLTQGGDGKAQGVFDLNMQDILTSKYADLINTLQQIKVVKEDMKMRDHELLEFDETCPVFLAQYGQYFAVTEIKSSSNGIAEVTMLQLDIMS